MTGKGIAIAKLAEASGKPNIEKNTAAIAILQESLKLNANQPLAKMTLDSLMKANAEAMASAAAKKSEANQKNQPINNNSAQFQLPPFNPSPSKP